MSLVQPFEAWPASDQSMWEALCREAGPLDDQGGLVHLRPTSRDTLQVHYGRWLKWLADTDPDILKMPPDKRATVGQLQKWLGALEHTKPISRLSFIGDAVRVLRAFSPDSDWSGQMQFIQYLRMCAGRGDARRKAGRVVSSDVLLKAGLRLANEDGDRPETYLNKLKRQRDGAMIAFLALLPIRLRAFGNLRVGRSIHFAQSGIIVSLPSELTKTGVPWEADVPSGIANLLWRYLEDVRPALMARRNTSHDVFWVSDTGAPYQLGYLSSRIGLMTKREIGIRVTPHLFRDCAATTLARTSPDAARLIPPVLSHSSLRTAERHYIHAGSIEASRNLAHLVAKLKKGGR